MVRLAGGPMLLSSLPADEACRGSRREVGSTDRPSCARPAVFDAI